MPKRSDTQESLAFALEILKRIPRNRKVSAPELHAQLVDAGWSRDLRTIQRQLVMLAEHFDIECDNQSKPYGYKWKEKVRGFSLPTMTEQESLLLALAEAQLRFLLPARLMQAMQPFFKQAVGQLKTKPEAKKSRAWLNKVRVVSVIQPLRPPEIKPGVFDAVSRALYDDVWLEVDYRNAENYRQKATVMPLGLAQQGPRLYLVCRFEGYDNERSLALHRLLSATLTNRSFKPPADFDLERYDNDGRFGYGEGNRIKLRFRIEKWAGQHLLETPLSVDQQVKEVDDALEISATVVESEQLKWWLRGFGEAVTVIAPKQLLG
jgi:predicted DNA-binding transcriptional regulator YafY